MNVSVLETDKLIVGTNDIAYQAPDISPTGTAVLNGPVYVGNPSPTLAYPGILNISSNSAPQQPFDTQPECKAKLAMYSVGNVRINGDGKTSHGLQVSGGGSVDVLRVDGDAFFSGSVDCGLSLIHI